MRLQPKLCVIPVMYVSNAAMPLTIGSSRFKPSKNKRTGTFQSRGGTTIRWTIYGTGSMPPGCQGWQRAIRPAARDTPRRTPCFNTACRAYCEHVGEKRQAAGTSGETSLRYRSISADDDRPHQTARLADRPAGRRPRARRRAPRARSGRATITKRRPPASERGRSSSSAPANRGGARDCARPRRRPPCRPSSPTRGVALAALGCEHGDRGGRPACGPAPDERDLARTPQTREPTHSAGSEP